MSNVRANDPSVWKMRNSAEPIPVGKRDQFRAARGIFWWLSVSLLLWFIAAAVALSIWPI